MTELAGLSAAPTPAKAVLLDGPLAGHLCQAGAEACWWHVRLPRPLSPTFITDPLEGFVAGSTTIDYRIATVEYPIDGQLFTTPVGWSGTERPTPEQVHEHIPTSLAEQHLIGWAAVPLTRLDRERPIQATLVGSPATPCELRVDAGTPWFSAPYITAACACGWSLELIEPDRRSQLLRAAHRHKQDEVARRGRYAAPIAVYNGHMGPGPNCYAGMSYVGSMDGFLQGSCRSCAFRTEPVEAWRAKPLLEICITHRGVDAIRRIQDTLGRLDRIEAQRGGGDAGA